jgi:hypothetical protein
MSEERKSDREPRHTHWGVEYLTNSSGRRWGWHLALQSIRRTKFEAMQEALHHFIGADSSGARWDLWHQMRDAGQIRAVKLTITKGPQ